jgi:post-segregation antitoxin (ccd killing protein)
MQDKCVMLHVSGALTATLNVIQRDTEYRWKNKNEQPISEPAKMAVIGGKKNPARKYAHST